MNPNTIKIDAPKTFTIRFLLSFFFPEVSFSFTKGMSWIIIESLSFVIRLI